jgi:HAE1 family hydrophobic/amphiphilic exporter-1
VETYQVSIGGGGIFGMGGTATGISVTVAKDTDLEALSDRLRDKLNRPKLGEVKVGADASGFNSDQISVTVTAPDEAALKPAAEQVRQALSGVPDLTEVTSDLAQGSPRVQVEVDGAAAAANGLSATTIGQIANQAIAGRTVTQLPVDGQRTDIVLRAGTAPVSVDAVKALPIPSATGVVRLDSVAIVSTVDSPAAVHRTSGELSTTVTAKNTGADLAATTRAIQTELEGLSFTGGAAYSLGGVSEDQQEAFGNLFLALLAAIAIVVIGGLVSSTLLTLVLVPTLYTMVETRKERRRTKRESRRTRSEAPAPEPSPPSPPRKPELT